MAATSCCVFIGMQARCATHNAFAKMIFSNAGLWSQVAAAPGSQHTSQICAGHSQWNLAVSDVLSFSLNTQGQGGRSAQDGMDAYGFAWCAFGRAPIPSRSKANSPSPSLSRSTGKIPAAPGSIAAVPAASSNG